jgi:hypothetical protein
VREVLASELLVFHRYHPMIRIEIRRSGDQLTFQIEGCLAGDFVAELKKCWKASARKRRISRVTVDLQSVTAVDDAGRFLLRRIYRDGAAFIGSRSLMQDVLAVSMKIHHSTKTRSVVCILRDSDQ